MREGPEHRAGWRRTYEVDGVDVTVEARHRTRRRMPRGHEIAGAYARGRPPEMVAETEHEWAVLVGGRLASTLRQNPNGTFSSTASRWPNGFRSIELAAASCAPGKDRTTAVVEDDVGPPGPPGPR